MLDILGYKPDEHKKLVTQDFVRQLYINAEPILQSDPPKFNFLWGERATIEFTKMEILNFASQVIKIVMFIRTIIKCCNCYI